MALSNKDAKKLLGKGFTILRKDDVNLKIKYKTKELSWKTLEDFETKASLNRRLSEFLELENFIED